MKKLLSATVLLAALSACAPSSQQAAGRNWDSLISSDKVARVTNIKSLEQPGFY